MDIDTERKEGVLILKPRGRIDSANAHDFQQSLTAAVGDRQSAVVADFEGISYMSSAGLRSILIVAKALRQRGAKFALCSMTPVITDVFTISGFSKVITVLDSQAEALAHMRGPGAAAAERREEREEKDALAEDERPVFAIGHVRLPVEDVAATHDFFARHGLRSILSKPDMAILELRGGTHLILNRAEQPIEDGAKAPFDLMVDDVDQVWQRFSDDGVHTTEIERGNIHDLFHITAPSGYWIRISSSHAEGAV